MKILYVKEQNAVICPNKQNYYDKYWKKYEKVQNSCVGINKYFLFLLKCDNNITFLIYMLRIW